MTPVTDSVNLAEKMRKLKYAETTRRRAEWYADALLAFLMTRPNEDVPLEEIKLRCKKIGDALAVLRKRGHRIDNAGWGGYRKPPRKSVRHSAYKLVVE